MKKYLETARVLFKAQIVYRFAIAFNMLFTIVKILFAVIVWGAIFEGRGEIAGFTYDAMLSYYVFSSFLSQLDMSDGVSGEISARIRDGSFSKYMIIPQSVPGNFTAQTLGASAFYLMFNLISAILWSVIFRIRFVVTPDAGVIACAALMILLGLVFMIQLNFFIGVLAFKFQDVSLFLMIKNTLVAFVTGTMIPLTLLPPGIQAVMRIFPFYSVTYLPSMMLIGKNTGETGYALMTLALWNLIFLPVNKMTYDRLRVRYDGVGV